MKLEDFTEKHIEGYLFCDLKKMQRLGTYENTSYGACGYSALQTIFSGIQLLGYLTFPDRSKPKDLLSYYELNWKIFISNYWTNFMPISYRNKININTLIKEIRNPLAHIFLTGINIFVVKGAPIDALSVDENGKIIVEMNHFTKDFIESYEKSIKPVINEAGNVEVNGMSVEKYDIQKKSIIFLSI